MIPSFVLITIVMSHGPLLVENDKLVPSEPRDHSIGTILMMSFFLKSHGNNIPLADSNSDFTWFIEKRNRIFQIEPCDHSIGTTCDAFSYCGSKEKSLPEWAPIVFYIYIGAHSGSDFSK